MYALKDSYNSILAKVYGKRGNAALFNSGPDIPGASRFFYIGALFNDPESLYKLAMLLENRVYSFVSEISDEEARAKLFYPDTSSISNKYMRSLLLQSLDSSLSSSVELSN